MLKFIEYTYAQNIIYEFQIQYIFPKIDIFFILVMFISQNLFLILQKLNDIL